MIKFFSVFAICFGLFFSSIYAFTYNDASYNPNYVPGNERQDQGSFSENDGHDRGYGYVDREIASQEGVEPRNSQNENSNKIFKKKRKKKKSCNH